MLERGDITIELQLRHPDQLPLVRVTSFLYDLALLHEYSVLVTDIEFSDYRFNPAFWRRNGRPLDDTQRLVVEALVLESPLRLRAGLRYSAAAMAALWVFIQAIDKLSVIDIHRQQVKAEVEHTIAETEKLRLESAEIRQRLGMTSGSTETIEELAARHGSDAEDTLRRLTNRLRAQALQVDALHVRPYHPAR
jgi:regulator of replication initiation timing